MTTPYKARCGCTRGDLGTTQCALPDKDSASEIKAEDSESETVIFVADYLERISLTVFRMDHDLFEDVHKGILEVSIQCD